MVLFEISGKYKVFEIKITYYSDLISYLSANRSLSNGLIRICPIEMLFMIKWERGGLELLLDLNTHPVI